MAMKLNAGEVTRQDEFLIDPQHILVDESLNGRWLPHDGPEVAILVKSFETEGQLQAVQVRRLADNRVQLVLGYRRYKAATQFNLLHPDNPMKLRCKVVIVNDEEALRRNIVENRERAETSPIDDAHNQRRLRENFGWTDVKIAEFYKMSPPYVGILKKLLTLSNDVQQMVHDRHLSVQAAVALADLPADQQQAVLAGGGEAITTQAVVKKVREHKIEKGGKQARSLREVREFLEGLTGPAEPESVRTFAETFLKFIQGTYTDKTMENKLIKFFHLPEVAEAPIVTPVETLEATVETPAAVVVQPEAATAVVVDAA